MFEGNATLSEDEFQECLEQAQEGLVISDWTPWGDLSEVLEEIASAPHPVAPELIQLAWGLYHSHVGESGVEKSAETGELSSTHRPLGTHGLWHDEHAQLPAYIQNIAHGLIEDGHSESEAIQLAIGAVRRWASGEGHVKPEVREASAKALAEWEKLKSEHNKSDGGV